MGCVRRIILLIGLSHVFVLCLFFFKIQVSHGIKLYPPNTPPTAAPPTDTETPVVAESYDEVVFTDPTETFFEQLQKVGRLPALQYSQQAHFPSYADTDDAQALLEAQKFLQTELAAVQERLRTVDSELQATDEHIRQAQERHKAASAAARNSSNKSATSSATAAAAARMSSKKN